MKDRIWTISNFLSFSRILLMGPVIVFFLGGSPHHREIAVLFVLLAVVTDTLDGYLARLLHQESEIGRIIDPLADKIGVGIVVVLLLLFGDIPLWFALLVLTRDIAIFCGGVYIKRRKGLVLPSNMAGKIAVSLVALTLTLAMLRYQMFALVEEFSLAASAVLLIVSFAVYVRRFLTVLSEGSGGGRV